MFICAKSRESVDSRVGHLQLHNKVRNGKGKWCAKLKPYFAILDSNGTLTDDQHKKFQDLRHKAETELITNADVICTTCMTSFDKRLNNITFNIVLIDEATQASEPECKYKHV